MLARTFAALLLLLFLTVPPASASGGEVVLLLRSSDASEAGQEAFNRLRGELALHGFNVEVIEVQGMATVADLESAADKVEAVASVAFIPAPGSTQLSRVDIWISDRVTGTTVKRTIRPGTGSDGPTILAVRALELLRSTLRSYDEKDETEDIEGAHPERARAAVQDLTETPPSDDYLYIAGGGIFAYSLPDGAPAGGPELAMGWQTRRWGMRVVAHGPLMGATTHSDANSFRALSFSALGEPSWAPLFSETWEISLFPSLGANYLAVTGDAGAPYRGRSDTAWLLTVGGGMELRARLASRLQIYTTARGLVMLPTLKIELANEVKSLGMPQISASAGLRLAL